MGKGRIGRRRRVPCALRCQVLGASRRPIEARVVQLSEGGLSVTGPLQVEHGDPIRIRLLHHRGAAAIEVAAIVWNDEPGRSALEEEGSRTVGCLVSDPPRSFLELFAQISRRNAPPIERRIPVVPARSGRAAAFEVSMLLIRACA